jgi:multidrug efflux pump subunit AcrB
VQVYTAAGEGFAGGNMFASTGPAQIRKATLTVSLKERQHRSRSQRELEAQMREKLVRLPGVRATVGSGGMGEQLTLILSGDDSHVLSQTSRQLLRELRTVPGIGSITSSDSLASPQLLVSPRFGAAADLGVTTHALGDMLRVATTGDYEQALAKLNLNDQQIPIRVRLPESARQDITILERLAVPGNQGRVMLGSVAELELRSGPTQINRYNGNRVVSITMGLNGRALGDVLAQVNGLPILQNLPAGVERVTGGDAEVMAELFESFGVAMVTGILCIYMILVLLFKDFLQPATIIAALPLSVGGAFAGLLLTDNALSMPSLIGILMLMGIAVKNSILLVEYTISARHKHSMTRADAVFDACKKRARPIMMTSVAMGAGMLPVALGVGADPSFRVPMATVIIGGLITSTLLSLLIIPVVFTYVDDLALWLRGRCKIHLSHSGVDLQAICMKQKEKAI